MDLLITAIIVLVVVGLVIWVVQAFLPIDARLKTLIIVLIILVAVLWLLQAAGIFSF